MDRAVVVVALLARMAPEAPLRGPLHRPCVQVTAAEVVAADQLGVTQQGAQARTGAKGRTALAL